MSEPGPEKKQHFNADGTPDWEAISVDVFCSRCGYNLRTLTRPRCTECGLDFDWRAVLDNATRRNAFLFEHHWMRRPLRSWGVTTLRSLRPKAFWGRVSLHEDVRPVPLIALFFLAVTSAFVFLHGSAWVLGRVIRYFVGPRRFVRIGTYQTEIRQRILNLASRMDDLADLPLMEGWAPLVWKGLAVATPFIGALVLLFALRQTMRRYRVRSIQLFRVVAYAATPVCLWWALGYLFTYYILPTMFQVMHFRTAMTYALAVLAWSVFSWYLARGFKQYLHLPHAAILGMTAALVGLLTLVTANLVVGAIEEGILG